MKISLLSKPYIIKACSFLVTISFVAGTPLLVDASFFSDLTTTIFGGGQVQADETPASRESSNNVVHNSQTVPLLETSINPDLKNTNEPKDIVIVQNDSFVYSDGLSVSDIKVEKSPLSDQISVYTVEDGDTLSGIAELFDVSINTIRWENNLSVGQSIKVGQKLNILPMTGVKHIVKSGDTISNIASKYEADIEDVMIFNDISKGDILKQGDIIFVPNGIIKPVVLKSTLSSPSSYTPPSNTKVQSGYYMRPAPGKITSHYGSRKRGFHPGVDIGNKRGTTVVAAADGVVSEVVTGCVEGRGSCGGGYGNHIDIEHSNGTSTRYAHLSNVSVSTGQNISQGEKIGAVGNTGNSTGPHLHFEIRNSNGSTMRPPV